MADTDAPDAALPSKEGEVQPVKRSQIRVLSRLPKDVAATASKADEFLLRLNKLIKTTAGLGAALSTLNYLLYLAADLHTRSPSRAAVIAYISRLVGRVPSKLASGAASAPKTSPLVPLASLVSDTRTTLRLTGLLPLYLWLKTLLSKKGSQGGDPVIHGVALVQCLAYIGYQIAENIYHLAGKGVVPQSFIAKRGGTMKWVVWSCRGWFVGVAADFVRLWREAVLIKEKRARGEGGSQEEQEAIDRKWWDDFISAAFWLPLAIHYSLEGGLKGMNTGIVGFCGTMAGLSGLRSAWAATAN